MTTQSIKNLPHHIGVMSQFNEKDWLDDTRDCFMHWAAYWSKYRDKGWGLGYPTMSTFERINHLSAAVDWGDLPPLPWQAEKIENALLGINPLPWEYRVVAWQWYVIYERHNMNGCARAVGRLLNKKISVTKFKELRARLLVAVAARMA